MRAAEWRGLPRCGQATLALLVLSNLLACAGRSTPSASTTAAPTSAPAPGIPPTPAYASRDTPLVARSSQPRAGVRSAGGLGAALFTGDYDVKFDPSGPALVIGRSGQAVGLAFQPLGPELNLMAHAAGASVVETAARPGLALTGSTGWAQFAALLSVYPFNPGLLHYQVTLTRTAEVPAGGVDPEWVYVDAASGEPASGGYTAYADRAAFAAPAFYGHSAALDTTLLLWVDLTRLNPFIVATRYSPAATPLRQGQRFGHNLTGADLRSLPVGQALVVYDGYLYLAPGAPAGETALFVRYLQQVADIYDLIARPRPALPDWQALATETLADLQDPDTWLTLNDKRYWRAYVADTRQSAEAITQFDVALGAARFARRFPDDPAARAVLDDALVVLPDFFNPRFGMIQNSGPLAVTGDQGRGDTWYEVGHALKAAELGVMGDETGARLALDSQTAWMDFARTVDHRFPRFFSFETWQGTEQEPDAGGGYALYMLRLAALGCGDPCQAEAEAALRATAGHGFGLAYETHMTAMVALAAAELADRSGDDAWLDYAYGPLANLVRLAWLYEVDYGAAAPVPTFFGLAPTQRAAAFTPKEQYEAWIYLGDFLRRAHGRLDPGVEKLVAEFYAYTLVTLSASLPPDLPAGVATEHPSAYPTVQLNRLDLHIPLEDLRDGYRPWGTIGQEVYGAGMAPTFAALAYTDLAPGLTIYSGYPLAAFDARTFTLAGVGGTFAPVQIAGAAGVVGADGQPVAAEMCGAWLCFEGQGGATYTVTP